MTAELYALAATVLVHFFAVGWAQRGLTADIGAEGNMGPRDHLDGRLSENTKRLRRAVDNHVENIGLFIIAVVLVQFSGSNSTLTAICAWIFVIARALYVPAYAFGWVPWRSVIFMVGGLATLVMILAAVF